MSARFFKIFAGVLVAHLVVMSVVWVGFSVPGPKPPAAFTYEGALPAGGGEDDWQQGEVSENLDIDAGGININHWIKFRSPSKPSISKSLR